jgi:WD40 repeat protein
LSEKTNAHSGYWIVSVSFSPDGTKIVSGSDDKTIKVWDAVNFRPCVESEWGTFDKTIYADDSDEEDEVKTWWRNKITGHEQSVKPSGGKRLPWNPKRSKSGFRCNTSSKSPLLGQTDACWLVWQIHWSC